MESKFSPIPTCTLLAICLLSASCTTEQVVVAPQPPTESARIVAYYDVRRLCESRHPTLPVYQLIEGYPYPNDRQLCEMAEYQRRALAAQRSVTPSITSVPIYTAPGASSIIISR